MNITNPLAADAAAALTEIDATSGTPASLDAILKRTLIAANTESNITKTRIEDKLADPAALTKPETLIEMQTDLSNYTIDISLISTLARKGVSTIETLVKAQ